MDIQNLMQLRPGDEVKWTDPDEGRCSRTYVIQTIRVRGRSVQITDKDGDTLECWDEELS